MDERRRQQLFVERPLLVHPVEDLQRVFEHVTLRMLHRILLHVLEHPYDLRDLVEAIAGQMREATGRIAATGHLATDLVMAGKLLLGHPAACHPPGRTKPGPRRVATVGHHPRRLLRDPLPQLVRTRIPTRIAHGSFPAAGSGRQRMFFTRAVVA